MLNAPDRLPSTIGESAPITTNTGSYTITLVSDGLWAIEGTTGGVPLRASLEFDGHIYRHTRETPMPMAGPRDADWRFVLRHTL